MTGQMDFFDLIEQQYAGEIKQCVTCENCKHTDLFKGNVWFCNPTRQVITEHTGSWLCKNREYERRVKA